MKSFFSKANGFIGIMFLLVIGWLPVQAQVTLLSQNVNPCGNDSRNEFLIFNTSASFNLRDIAYGSYKPDGAVGPQDYNYWWYGTNVPSCPYSGNMSATYTSCATSSDPSIATYGFLYPSNSTDAAIIDARINELNTAAGCNVFISVPSTNQVPANSLVIIFNGAGSPCGFDNVSSYLNFSNHCVGGVPKVQYYAIFGYGDTNCSVSGGYFSNSDNRVTKLWIYNGSGSYLDSMNYYRPQQYYNPSSVTNNTINAGFVLPNTNGAGVWVKNQGCVPSTVSLGVLAENNIRLDGAIHPGYIHLDWQINGINDIANCQLEKSEDAAHFTAIYLEEGAAYTAYRSHQFDDRQSNTAKIYYRVKVIMNDGRFYYSNIVKFKLYSFQSDDLLLLSNPVISTLNFKLAIKQPGLFNFTIFNTAGSKVYSSAMHLNRGEQVINLPVSHFASGVYYLSASNNEDSFTKTFIKK